MRNNVINALFITLFLSIASSTNALTERICWPNFYVGADAQIRNMRFAHDFGGNIYHSIYPGANFYFGIMGNEYFALESGFETSRSQTRHVYLPAGATLLGVPVNFPIRQNVVVRTRGLHTSLIGFFPITCDKKFNLFLAVGVVNLTVKLENSTTEIANLPTLDGLTLSQSKNILRLMTGLQYMFTDYFGIRTNVRWENTAQFRNIEPIRLDSPNTAKAKNSIVYGLGCTIKFY